MKIYQIDGFVTRDMINEAIKARDAHLKDLLSKGLMSVADISNSHGVSTDKVRSMRQKSIKPYTQGCVTQWDLEYLKMKMRDQMVYAVQQGEEVDKLAERHHVTKYMVYKLRSQMRLGLVDLTMYPVACIVSPPAQDNESKYELCPRCDFQLFERIDEVVCIRCGYVWYSGVETAHEVQHKRYPLNGDNSSSIRRGCSVYEEYSP